MSGTDEQPHIDWRGLLASSLNTLQSVPALDLVDASDADVDLLNRVRSTVDMLMHQLESARSD